MVASASAEPQQIIPLDLHFFEEDKNQYAIDARSLFVLKLSPISKAVLELMKYQSLDEIICQLESQFARSELEGVYKGLLNLAVKGIFTLEDVETPDTPGLQNIVLMTAGGCNMGCTYCFEHDVPTFQSPNLLSKKQCDHILDWFIENHEGPNVHIQFYGGEPLMNWELIPYALERLESWAQERNNTNFH